MNDEELRSLLRSLPRERASGEFTDRVMSRLDTAPRRLLLAPKLAVAASLVLVAAWVGLGKWRDTQRTERTRHKVQELRTELEQLQRNILLLRDLAPVLYVGGDEDVDLVLDLRPFVEGNGGETLRPASSGEMKPMPKGEHRR